VKSFKSFVLESTADGDPIKEGFLRALGMGAATAAGGEIAARVGATPLPPGVGAALATAWYIASGEAKKDYNHGKKKAALKSPKAKWPVVPFKPSFA